MKSIIVVAAHKKFDVPADSVYLPVQVGAAGKADLGYQRDDMGDNISNRNPYYCELTGLYWAWKNLDAEYIGLAHYRRFWVRQGVFGKKILSGKEIDALTNDSDIIVPERRNYYIESNYSQYVHAHNGIVLDYVREVICDLYPYYADAYDERMRKSWGHRFNMMIMKRELLDGYCSWLFGVLFELEKRIRAADDYELEPRVMGFISERLIDVWLDANGLSYKEIPYINTEGENKLKKGIKMIGRKAAAWRR